MQLKQLCIITGFKKAKKGDIIYLYSSDAPKIYFLKKGNIKIAEIDEEGNEITKEIIQKGDLFGELSLDTTIKSNEYAQALTNDVTICSFLLSDFEALMEKYPGLALSYTKFVGLRFKKMSSNYSNLIFKDARSRLLYFIKEWAKIHKIAIGTTNEEIVANLKVIERIQEEVDKLNEKFGNWEKIKRFELTPDVWSIEAGHLTPTLKLKRKIVMEKYLNLFHKIYN